MAKDYEQSARDYSVQVRDVLRELLGNDAVIHVDMHGVATVRADVLISALQRGAR